MPATLHLHLALKPQVVRIPSLVQLPPMMFHRKLAFVPRSQTAGGGHGAAVPGQPLDGRQARVLPGKGHACRAACTLVWLLHVPETHVLALHCRCACKQPQGDTSCQAGPGWAACQHRHMICPAELASACIAHHSSSEKLCPTAFPVRRATAAAAP